MRKPARVERPKGRATCGARCACRCRAAAPAERRARASDTGGLHQSTAAPGNWLRPGAERLRQREDAARAAEARYFGAVAEAASRRRRIERSAEPNRRETAAERGSCAEALAGCGQASGLNATVKRGSRAVAQRRAPSGSQQRARDGGSFEAVCGDARGGKRRTAEAPRRRAPVVLYRERTHVEARRGTSSDRP